MARAKAKVQETLNLDAILFKCRDILRKARNSGSFFEKRDIMLTLVFLRFIGEKFEDGVVNLRNSLEKEGLNPDDPDIRAAFLDDPTFVDGTYNLPKEARWQTIINTPAPRLNVALDDALRSIAETNSQLKGCFVEGSFTSRNLAPIDIKQLVDEVNKISHKAFGEEKDLIGHVYEYFLREFAVNATKEEGEFYTPHDVVQLIASMIEPFDGTLYDPACGSGSLLLKAEKVLGKDAIRNGFYGQEINITTYNLCRINMFLHDVGFDKFNIACEDTLISPQHWDDEPFELIVSNPPYSIKWAGDSNPLLINDPRFAPAGVLAPKSKADMAFIMHSLSWLAANGTAAIVCFPGIMYRGGAEKKIRKYLVDNNFIDCIIQLPSNLFFGTSIATCIMVMKKNKTDNRTLFIDASSECVKVTNNNKLTAENIARIVDVFAKHEEIPHFSKLAEYQDIVDNEYNLSVSTYVEAKDTREKVDIVKLNEEIREIVAREDHLRAEIDRIIAEIEVGTDE